MNPQQEEFSQLRRLLAVKRYEQPPPGFFEGFSHEVSARIRAEQQSDYLIFSGLSLKMPWLQRLWGALETRPIFAGGFGMAVCGLLLVGVLVSEKADPAMAGVSGSPPARQMADAREASAPPLEGGFSLEPVTFGQERDMLFQRVNESLKAKPALYTVPNGN